MDLTLMVRLVHDPPLKYIGYGLFRSIEAGPFLQPTQVKLLQTSNDGVSRLAHVLEEFFQERGSPVRHLLGSPTCARILGLETEAAIPPLGYPYLFMMGDAGVERVIIPPRYVPQQETDVVGLGTRSP